MFSPVISGKYSDKVFTGVLVLFGGLMGALLIYKATKEGNENKKLTYILVGGIIMFLDSVMIMASTGIFG